MKLIDEILDKSNVRLALEKVLSNQGAPGIDRWYAPRRTT